ncbi:hypothetical protein [Sphingobium yanoikuyae]|uniref:hypothetical protein n=1 Tax=Sphingobium yanoikuyae TaxID=13690 RepID=UPI0022DD89A0|nr:hypothetical protein [Sphingobium yanoikuyae]WBQ15052.1 hypothetical protein PAE53_14060 [Sphingobium yanoikuyae]
MSQMVVADLEEVLVNADQLLESHTKRNPQTAALEQSSREIERLMKNQQLAAGQIRLARIAFTLGHTAGAAEHLLTHVPDEDDADRERKAKLAVEIAQSLGGRRSRDSHPLPDDLKGVFAKLETVTSRYPIMLIGAFSCSG